jgi:hypothetical protein
MPNLDLTKEKIQNLDNLENIAIRTLTEALDDEREVDDKVQLAMKTANMVAKNRQTMTAREGIRFSMAQSIATESQMKKYVEVTQPEVKKALNGKKG